MALTEHDRVWERHRLEGYQARYQNLFVAAGMEVSTELGHILAYGLPQYIAGIRRAAELRRVADELGAFLAVAIPLGTGSIRYGLFGAWEEPPEMVPETHGGAAGLSLLTESRSLMGPIPSARIDLLWRSPFIWASLAQVEATPIQKAGLGFPRPCLNASWSPRPRWCTKCGKAASVLVVDFPMDGCVPSRLTTAQSRPSRPAEGRAARQAGNE